MFTFFALTLLLGVAFAEEQSVEDVEQSSPQVIGLFGGIVHQPNPGALFNMTMEMTPTGAGMASFFNPALGFKCLGQLKWHSGQTYLYNLVVDHSSVQGACLVWGNIIMSPGPGYATVSLYPQGSGAPAFTTYLTQWV